jgi:hypothetical protein
LSDDKQIYSSLINNFNITHCIIAAAVDSSCTFGRPFRTY